MEVLSDWHGMVAYIMTRARIQKKELMAEMKVGRSYVTRITNEEGVSPKVQQHVIDALRSCVYARDDTGELWRELTARFRVV